VFVARVGADEDRRTVRRCAGDYIVLGRYFPIWRTKRKETNYWDCLFGGGEGEEKPEGGKLLLCVCFTRAGLLENKRLGAFIVPYSEHVTGASIFVRDCIVL